MNRPGRLWSALGFALAFCLAACGKEAASTAGGSADPSGPTRLRLLEPEAFASQTLGGLHGTILFEGQAPERFAQGASSLPECKHHPEVDMRSNLVVVNEGKVAGVFVTLASGYSKHALPPLPDGVVTLDQMGCMYVPRVLGLRVGQRLQVTNLDPTAHNVRSSSKRNAERNTTMGANQQPVEFTFERQELPIPFKCDIHTWMGAAVFVEEHPWFAVSDEAGTFRIRDVPPGEYIVQALHEKLSKASGTVRVEAGKSTGFTLTLRP